MQGVQLYQNDTMNFKNVAPNYCVSHMATWVHIFLFQEPVVKEEEVVVQILDAEDSGIDLDESRGKNSTDFVNKVSFY